MIELEPGEQLIVANEKNGRPLENLQYIAKFRCPTCKDMIITVSNRNEYRAYDRLKSAKRDHCCEVK